MRRTSVIGLGVGAAAICGIGLFLLLHRPDPLATGRRLMEKGDMHRAALYLREAVRNQPDSAEAAFRLGVADLALGNAPAAELELKRARQHGYDPQAVLLPLGQAYLQQHQYDRLLRDFPAPAGPPAARADTEALRSAAELAQGNLQTAADDAAAAVAAGPDDAQAQVASARVALARGDIAAASASLAHVLSATPHQPDALLLHAGIALNQGHGQVALDDAGIVLADNPRRIDAKLMRVRALAIMGHEKEARALVDDVLHAVRRDPGANYLRMVLAIRSHDWDAANESLDVISPLIGNLPRGLFYMALIKMNVGQPAQAEEAATKFLTIHPDDIGAHKLMALIDLNRHRPAEARAQLQDIVAGGHADADTLDLMGRAEAMAGDPKAAEATLAQATALAPRDPVILNRLAGVRLALGETDMAEQDLHDSLAIDPHQAQTGAALVRGLLERGDTAGATKALDGLRQALGDTALTGVLSAEIQLAAYDLPGAQSSLQAVLKTFPDDERATLMLVRVDGQLGEVEPAQSLLAGMLKRHPADETALEMELPLLLSQGKTDQAVAVAEAAHQAGAGRPGIIAALAATYLRAHDPDRAIALLDRAGAVSQDPALTLLRARALATAGRTALARDAYRDLLEASAANVEARRELAMLLTADHKLDEARATLRDGLRAAPGNLLLMGSLVGLELKAGGTAAALKTAAALAADPANLPAARQLPGDLWAATGDQAKAASAYQAAFKAAPSGTLAVRAADSLAHAGHAPEAEALLTGWLDTHPNDVAALSVLSSLQLQSNQAPQAEATLNHLVALQPADAAALNNLAWLRGRQGDLPAALALARRAYFLAPGANAADTLGWIMDLQGDATAALPLLQKASAAGHTPDQLYHYAAALAQTGSKDQAKSLLKQLLDQNATFDERPDAARLLETLAAAK
jgi:putative PEP-CTERM system TPR-repeat lipoprotein